MNRGRQGLSSSDGRKRGKGPVTDSKASSGPSGQKVKFKDDSSKFKGSMVAPRGIDYTPVGIDSNLLVGPLYETPRKDRIKGQLEDITEKLHKTLYAFDEFDEFEHEDPALAMMRDRIGQVNDKNMRTNLVSFMDQYDNMSHQVASAHKDRDDMLMQLADWFTTDHVDLDDIKSSVDDSEEEALKQSYFSTMTNFEKLKKIQNQIMSASEQGKSTRQLTLKKFELEKNVVDQFQVVKDMSMQTMKLKVPDDAPWKHAANEIVTMLKNVRAENLDEMTVISTKMHEMIAELEKQSTLIKSLNVELREKKRIVQKLTDENSDLSQEVMVIRHRYTRYEKDLEAAQALIRTLNAQKVSDGSQPVSTKPNDDKSMAAVTTLLSKIEEPVGGVKDVVSSDPAILRAQLRDFQEELATVKSEHTKATEDIDELTVELLEKKAYIASIEAENEKLSKDVKRLKQERRKSVAIGLIAPTEPGVHKCEHCKCHVADNVFEEEIEELKQEVEKWQEKCNYFKTCLADTEMKLSDAFREISSLRMDRELPLPPPPPTSSEPEVVKGQPVKKKEEQDQTPVQTPVRTPIRTPISPKESKPATCSTPRPKPKKDVKPRYLDRKPQSDQPQPLPPLERAPFEEMGDLTSKQSRDLKLYKAGDLQGKLNMLLSEVMEFVSEIGKMLHVEKDDEASKTQNMTAFNFESQSAPKRQKEVKDPKDEEARQKKTMVIFSGQIVCAKLREVFETLSGSLKLQHNEYETIYRSFKISQQRNNIRQAVLMGRMPMTALKDFDHGQKKRMQEAGEADILLHSYFTFSYGGGGGAGGGASFAPTKQIRQGRIYERESSVLSTHSDYADESEAKLKNRVHVLNVQRSKSDLDVRDAGDSSNAMSSIGILDGGILKERSHISMTSSSEQMVREGSMAAGPRQEMKVGMATVNKKGLISLGTPDDSKQLQELAATGESRRLHSVGSDNSGKLKSRSLIKRKDLMGHFKAGFKILEDEELQKHEEEELQKSLGDYTIMDLQSKILEMTDAKSVKRLPGGESPTSPKGPRKVPTQMKQDKTFTLPAIKNFNPFILKS